VSEYIHSQKEWKAFWGWFKNHLPSSVVSDPKYPSETPNSFKSACEIAIYDWYHYKRIEMKWLSDRKVGESTEAEK